MTTFQPERERSAYINETTVHSVKRENPPSMGHRSDSNGNTTEFSYTKESSIPAMDAPLPLGIYLKGLGRVLCHMLNSYKDLAVDIFQSLWVIFLQYPAVGVFLAVTGGFILAPVGIFLGFLLASFIGILVSALVVQGVIMGGAFLALFVAMPISVFIGLGAGSTAALTWVAVNAIVKLFRGRNIVDEFSPRDTRTPFAKDV